jgi:hypothetical protein
MACLLCVFPRRQRPLAGFDAPGGYYLTRRQLLT